MNLPSLILTRIIILHHINGGPQCCPADSMHLLLRSGPQVCTKTSKVWPLGPKPLSSVVTLVNINRRAYNTDLQFPCGWASGMHTSDLSLSTSLCTLTVRDPLSCALAAPRKTQEWLTWDPSSPSLHVRNHMNSSFSERKHFMHVCTSHVQPLAPVSPEHLLCKVYTGPTCPSLHHAPQLRRTVANFQVNFVSSGFTLDTEFCISLQISRIFKFHFQPCRVLRYSTRACDVC